MELLKLLDMRKSGTASRAFRWGLFLCPFCRTEVERTVDNGKLAKSCGCMQSEGKTLRHGLARVGNKHPLYNVWTKMKDRCYNPNGTRHERYGGRGISICAEWISDFSNFFKWSMENGWQEGLEIDRENNDGNYEPSNCRFVTGEVNIQNSSAAKLSPEDVRQIKTGFPASGMSYRAFGKIYDVTGETISAVIRGKTWSNIL